MDSVLSRCEGEEEGFVDLFWRFGGSENANNSGGLRKNSDADPD